MDYSNFKIDMPNDVEFIINTIKSHGHQAYAVGGSAILLWDSLLMTGI